MTPEFRKLYQECLRRTDRIIERFVNENPGVEVRRGRLSGVVILDGRLIGCVSLADDKLLFRPVITTWTILSSEMKRGYRIGFSYLGSRFLPPFSLNWRPPPASWATRLPLAECLASACAERYP